MNLSNIEIQQIRDYALNTNVGILAGLGNGPFSPCASFVYNLMINAIGKQIIDAPVLFNNQLPFNANLIHNYNELINIPCGSILGVFKASDNMICHYILKLDGNTIIGANHGGILMQRLTHMKHGFMSYIIQNDFLPGNFFDYEVPQGNYVLFNLDYNV